MNQLHSTIPDAWVKRECCGTVQSGNKDLSIWMIKLHDLYRRKTGQDLVPGSLNVCLETPYSVPRDTVRIEPGEDGCRVGVSIVPCKINGREAFVVRTDANESGDGVHSKNIVEIVCSVQLRNEFNLKDGDSVNLQLHENAG